ncbi:M23 family metallopeptidase [Metasolibacillus sp.]|uniref:peptidoglycan DD-metalloendopeptidase family protein n=1 Tax=Metasolibacillus sp. TaxID=2703680 RepID=UPI0025E348A5|nr:M23 family metallopeptidase [Metasolibacillus sp.]MCT6924266.1 M23 family metallopeptidase [Metasolibacillus sp.]MCT6940332.1 M23 family metallopeptidase [Metasolibacillus sp.]
MSSKWNIAKDAHRQLDSLLKQPTTKIKQVAATVLLCSTLVVPFAFIKEAEANATFGEIYHIYANNSYIGAVSNPEAVEQLLAQKEQQASEKYAGLAVDAHSNVEIIPEQVFEASANDTETLTKLEAALVIEADAHSLKVNGETIAYVENEDALNEVLKQLKLQYVTEDELASLTQPATAQLPVLQDDETRIVDISLSAEVNGEATKALPNEILSVDEAVQFLQTGMLEQQKYAIQSGDVLGSIAHAHDLTIEELMELNPGIDTSTVLQIGQELNVTVNKPFITVKVVEEKFKVEAIDHAKMVEEDETMLKGEKVVKQEGADGKKEVTYLITTENGKRTERAVKEENIISEPSSRIVVVGTKVIPSRGTGSFAWPTNGGYISSHMGSRWGEFHRGIDIARPSNYTIKAADNGVVTFTGWDGTYGNKIVVNHNNGYETVYAHLSQIDVTVGQVVAQGSALGIMGSTGNSTGTHLHFEVHENGAVVNPLSYLK